MRCRIWLVATVVAAGSLVAGAALASAATKSVGPATAKPVMLKCQISMATQPPPGSNFVDQPPAQGKQYGPISCPTKSFGGGVESDSFTVPDSGDTVGKYVQYFHNGSIRGKFDLTPNEGATPTSDNFESESWTGTLTVTKGTGAFKGIKSKKGTGVINCTSEDSVHLTCTEHVKVRMPSAG